MTVEPFIKMYKDLESVFINFKKLNKMKQLVTILYYLFMSATIFLAFILIAFFIQGDTNLFQWPASERFALVLPSMLCIALFIGLDKTSE